MRPTSHFLFVNLNVIHSARPFMWSDLKCGEEAVVGLILNSQSVASKILLHLDMLVTDLVEC